MSCANVLPSVSAVGNTCFGTLSEDNVNIIVPVPVHHACTSSLHPTLSVKTPSMIGPALHCIALNKLTLHRDYEFTYGRHYIIHHNEPYIFIFHTKRLNATNNDMCFSAPHTHTVTLNKYVWCQFIICYMSICLS